MENLPAQTLQEAVKFFADPDKCDQFMISVRWADGKVRCPTCGAEKVTYLAKSRLWKCYEDHPRAKFSLKVGTIFEDSKLPLEKWMRAIWLIANCKNGISSCELARHLGITQKAAWHVEHRIRAAMRVGSLETGTGGKDKVIVMRVLQPGAHVRTTVMSNRKKYALQAEVRKHLEVGSALYSDALKSDEGLASEYAHKVIDHAIAYIDGQVHTHGLEIFWSLRKRSISGTHVSVEPFHLFRYLDEQSFRYNHCKLTDSERFSLVTHQSNRSPFDLLGTDRQVRKGSMNTSLRQTF